MSTIAKKTEFDHKAFRERFEALARQNPTKATRLAEGWASRLRNALLEAETMTEIALESSVVFATAGLFGYIDEAQEIKRARMIEQWKAGLAGTDTESEVAKKAAEWLQKETRTQEDIDNSSPFDEGGFSDPATFLKLPYSFWGTLALAGGAYLARNTGFASTVRAATLGSLGALGAEVGRGIAANVDEARQEKENKDQQNGG